MWLVLRHPTQSDANHRCRIKTMIRSMIRWRAGIPPTRHHHYQLIGVYIFHWNVIYKRNIHSESIKKTHNSRKLCRKIEHKQKCLYQINGIVNFSFLLFFVKDIHLPRAFTSTTQIQMVCVAQQFFFLFWNERKWVIACMKRKLLSVYHMTQMLPDQIQCVYEKKIHNDD